MNREEYRSLLGQLPIKNPTPDDMARLCPHLTREQAVTAFKGKSRYIACPPLRVRNAFQIVSYDEEWVEEIKVWVEVDGKMTRVVTGRKNHPPKLSYSYASRTRASYVDGRSHGDAFTSYRHTNEAMKFAEDNWGKDLILDDWDSVVEFFVQDSTDLVNDAYHRDYPRTKAVLYVTLDRDLNKIINDHSKPQSEMFDDAIAQMTLDPAVWHELKGGRGGFTEFNCAHCGAGLGLSGCTGCGHEFRDDQYRCGWSTPLSKKMVTFFSENDHVFKVDPEIAWIRERQHWEEGRLAYREMLQKRRKC